MVTHNFERQLAACGNVFLPQVDYFEFSIKYDSMQRTLPPRTVQACYKNWYPTTRSDLVPPAGANEALTEREPRAMLLEANVEKLDSLTNGCMLWSVKVHTFNLSFSADLSPGELSLGLE